MNAKLSHKVEFSRRKFGVLSVVRFSKELQKFLLDDQVEVFLYNPILEDLLP